MEHYFEVEAAGEVTSFVTLDDATKWADEYDASCINEIGGSWTDYKRCSFCHNWFDSCHLNTHDECPICKQIIYQQLKERY